MQNECDLTYHTRFVTTFLFNYVIHLCNLQNLRYISNQDYSLLLI